MAHFWLAGSAASSSEALQMQTMYGSRSSITSGSRKVGIGSREQLFDGEEHRI
jgi:hypothetical protein